MHHRLGKLPRPSRRLWIVAIVCVLLASLSASTAIPTAFATQPQPDQPSADIVIDGRSIFQLQSSGQFTAKERVAPANHILETLVNSHETPKVTVVRHNQQPILLANDSYLLTVTALDAKLNQRTPLHQAYIWSKRLERSLKSARKERAPAHTRGMLLIAGLTLAVTLALHISLGRLWERAIAGRLIKGAPADTTGSAMTGHTPAEMPPLLLADSLKLWLLRLTIWAIALTHTSSLFPALRQQRYTLSQDLVTSTHSPLFSLGSESYTVIDILFLIGLIGGLFLCVRLSTSVLSTHVLGRTSLARGSREVITQSFRYGAFTIGLLLLLRIWGIDSRSIALLGSALGIGIGFGLQDIAKNFGSGLVLLFERSVQVGDFIEIDKHTGVVERIGARSITIRTLDNISVLVPNAHLLDSQVVNWNHDHPVSRLHVTIGTAYEADSKLVRSLLLQAARENLEVLPEPPPNVFLKNFGDSAIEFDLLVWIRKPERHAAIRSALNFRIEEILNQHNIAIPFPQRDVNLKIEKMPIEFSPDLKAAILSKFGQKTTVQKTTSHYP